MAEQRPGADWMTDEFMEMFGFVTPEDRDRYRRQYDAKRAGLNPDSAASRAAGSGINTAQRMANNRNMAAAQNDGKTGGSYIETRVTKVSRREDLSPDL